jgi:tetratricopeptide (TPR) repeat protein
MTVGLFQELYECLGDKCILIVEPRAHFRVTLQSFLSQLKFENVTAVSNVAEARLALKSMKIGFIIAEWQLPEMNGLELCREVRRDPRYRTIPYLLTTTENLKADIILASEGGISSCLLKPYSFQDFCDQLRIIVSNEKNPSHIQSLLERAEAYLERKEFWVAEALYQEALNIRPQSARAVCGLGRIALLHKQTDRAIQCFKQAVENNPEYIDGYKQLLKISQEHQDHTGIIQGATILHKLSPENPRYPLMIAASQMELGKYTAAEEYFKITLTLSPRLASAYKGLGNLYLRTKEFDKAAINFEKALDLEKSDIATINSLGLSYVRQKLIDKGIDRYRLALVLSPNEPRVLFNLGLALELKGSAHEAQQAFEKAYQLDPNFEKARRKLSERAPKSSDDALLNTMRKAG